MNLLGLKCQLGQIPELKNLSNVVDEALNGEEAVEMFEKRIELCKESNWLIKPYRIIFIDFNMPIMDGPSAIVKIRGICQEIKQNDVQIVKSGGIMRSASIESIGREFRSLTQVQRDIYLNPFIIVLSGESDKDCI